MEQEPKKNRYHIVWMLRTDEHGTELSTGKDYEAVDMIHALMLFSYDHPEIDPLYCLKKS